MEIIYILAGSLLSGIAYYLGGETGYDTKIRDIGVPIIMLGTMYYIHLFHWSLLICAILLFGVLTTYWKKKGTDANWFNWLCTGLGYSLAMLPYAYFTGCWIAFTIRTILLTFLTMWWSEKFSNVMIEAGGRGVLVILTLSLFMLRR